jgi:hypothetical protein
VSDAAETAARGPGAPAARAARESRTIRRRPPPWLIAAGLYALFAVALFWPVLDGSRVFSAAADLYTWVPWRTNPPPGLGGYSNPLLSDHTRSFYPWTEWARQQLRAGHLPQWNPYALSGTPFVSNAQAQLFSPFSLPVWLLAFPYGLGVAAALKLWAGAIGAYLLCRELRLRFAAALLAGLSYGFGPYLVIWLSHPVTPEAAVLPWMLLAAERIVRRGRGADALLLAGACLVLFLGGYPEGQAQMCLATAIWTAVRLATAGSLAPRAIATRAGLVAAGIALGACLAAVAIVPFVLAVPGTAGLATRMSQSVEPVRSLVTVAFPNWWGRPSGYVTPGAPHNYNMVNMYAGTVALVLAAVALLGRSGWRRMLAPAVLAALGVACDLGVPPLPWVFGHVPGFDHARNQLLVVLLDLGVAVLSGFGVDRLCDRRRPARTAVALTAAAALAVAAAGAASAGLGGPALHAALHHFLTGAAEPHPAVNRLIAVGWWVLLAGGCLAVAAFRRWLPPALVATALVGLCAADSAHFFDGYQPMPPAPAVFPETPAIRFLQTHQGAYRVTAVAPAMPADTGMVYGLRDIRGLDPPQPGDAYARLIRLTIPHPHLASNTNLQRLDGARLHVLDLLSVRYVLAGRGTRLDRLPGLRPAYAGPDAQIVRNAAAVAPASVPARVLVEPDDAAARRAIAAAWFTPGADATTTAAEPAGRGSARVSSDAGGRVVIAADMRRAGLVVLSDAWTPGWSVTVDGRAAAPLRVDTAIRGVVVPRGRHLVVWTYSTPGLVAAAWLSAAAAAVAAGWAALLLGRRRRAGTGAAAV